MSKSKKNHYLDKREFHEAFVRWHARKVDGKLPPIPDDIARGFMLLADNIIRSGKFNGYTWTEELKGFALLICTRYAHNYKPEQSSEAFDYFSRTITHAFWQENARQKKQNDIVTAYNSVVEPYVNSEFHDINFVPPTINELRKNQDELELSKSTY